MSSGGGTTQTSGEVIPYSPTEPYLADILGEAENIYASDVGKSYFPSSTVVPFAPQTQQALNLTEAQAFDQMGGSNLYNTAANTYGDAATGAMGNAYGGANLGMGMGNAFTNDMGTGFGSSYTGRTGYAGGPAYNALQPGGDYLSDVRSTIASDVMGNIQSQFGGMGRTGGSPGAQQAASRGFTQAYAPIAQSAAEAERQRALGSYEADLNRFQQSQMTDIGRQQQAGESQQARLNRASQANIARRQQGFESQFGRQSRASQADIARGQQARESQFGRRMSGAAGLPGMQSAMDQRIAGGISGLGGVGGAYEELGGRQMQDQMNRYNFSQQSPYARLAAYSQMVNPIAGMGYAGSNYQPDASPLLSGMTGAMLGSQLMPGFGTAAGGIAGLMGLL